MVDNECTGRVIVTIEEITFDEWFASDPAVPDRATLVYNGTCDEVGTTGSVEAPCRRSTSQRCRWGGAETLLSQETRAREHGNFAARSAEFQPHRTFTSQTCWSGFGHYG